MYVPPDEPVQEMGEINMTFQDEHGRQIHHTGTHIVQTPPGAHVALHPSSSGPGAHGSNGHARYGDAEPIAAVNPIYQRY